MKLMLALLAALVSTSAFAGDALTFKELEKGEGYFRIFLEPARLKVELSDNGKDVDHTMLFSKGKQEATVLDHKKKEFMVMDKESLKKIADKMGGAMEQMKAAMSKLPPEMQKMMKEKMAAMNPQGGKDKPPVDIKKLKSGEKVGQWSATHYEVTRGKDTVSDLWTVPFKEVGVDEKNYEVVKSLGDTFSELGKEMQKVFGTAASHPQSDALGVMRKLEGFPVKTVSKRDGKKDRGYLLEKAEKKDLSDADFSVPDGYKKKSFGMM